MAENTHSPIKIFVCYAHGNSAWLKEDSSKNLIPYLQKRFEDDGVIFWWDKAKHEGIKAGDEWDKTIRYNIADSDIAIVLICGDLVASNYVMKFELPEIHKRYDKKELAIVPILVSGIGVHARKKLEWLFGSIQIIPSEKKCLDDYKAENDWQSIREEIVDQINDMIPKCRLRRVQEKSTPVPEESMISNSPASFTKPSDACVVHQSATFNFMQWIKRFRWYLLSLLLLFCIQGVIMFGPFWGCPKSSGISTSMLEDKFHQLPWIAYDPTGHDDLQRKFPSDESMRSDLRVLRSLGFKGVITFGSEGMLNRIPPLAKEVGFDGVVMGIADPADTGEIAQAIAQKQFVDGYCVGHNALSGRYRIKSGEDQLIATLKHVRQAGGRPVTTTDTLETLQYHTNVLNELDWFFPDARAFWHENADPEQVLKHTMDSAYKAEKLVSGNGKRLVVLKMICYPSGGVDGGSPENQARFFELLLNHHKNDPAFSANVHYTFFDGFDSQWKSSTDWAPAERFLGLCDSQRKPKPAAERLRGWLQGEERQP